MRIEARMNGEIAAAKVRALIEACEEIGLDVKLGGFGGTTVTFECGELPSRYEARKMRTRGAGRSREWDMDSDFEDKTCAEVLAYMDANTATETADMLGMSRSTFYRWLPKIRELENAQRRVRDVI